MSRYIYAFILILAAALSRMLPHLPNMVPVTALALFAGVYLDRRLTFVVPMAAMLITDWFIGFHSTAIWVYASFVVIGFVGLWLRNHQGVVATIGASVTGSLLFYLITNFGVWLSPPFMYEQTLSGLVQCYVAAIPFFRNTLAGNGAGTTLSIGGKAVSIPLIQSGRVSAPKDAALQANVAAPKG